MKSVITVGNRAVIITLIELCQRAAINGIYVLRIDQHGARVVRNRAVITSQLVPGQPTIVVSKIGIRIEIQSLSETANGAFVIAAFILLKPTIEIWLRR